MAAGFGSSAGGYGGGASSPLSRTQYQIDTGQSASLGRLYGTPGGSSQGGPVGGTVGPKVNPNYQQNANVLAGLMNNLQQAPQAAAPKYTGTAQVNPLLGESYNASKKAVGAAEAAQGQATQAFKGAQTYADSLADRSNESITNAMQRGRDSTASALSDIRAGAGARGGGPGSGLSNVLQVRGAMAGNRQNQALNASLTDVALQREGEARRGVTEAAGTGISGANAITGATANQGNAAASAAGEQDRREESNRDMFRWSSDYSQRQAEGNRNQNNYLVELALRNANPWTGMA